MTTLQIISTTLVLAVPVSALLGLMLAQWAMRRGFDREMQASLMRGLPLMIATERTIRKTVVDRQCERVKQRAGEAAYCDIHIHGHEVTLVGARAEHLEGFAKACDQYRAELEAVMKLEHLKRRKGDGNKVVAFEQGGAK
jgi:hypothetical protein